MRKLFAGFWLCGVLSMSFINAGDSPMLQEKKDTKMVLNEKLKQQLLEQALEARTYSYSPYSNYKVGAALLTSGGLVYKGTNVENASYGLTCCAERAAVFKAISEGVRDFVAIAVVGKNSPTPCGACLQVLNEFNSNLVIISGDENGNLVGGATLEELLPRAFGPKNLK
jgi:cytidine deaminase